MEKTMICIVCPAGCAMEVWEQDGELSVSGNRCKRGEQFAVSEMTNPMRTICSTVKTVFPEAPVVPVRVSCDIPKGRIFDVMAEINRVLLRERVGRGAVVIPNVLGLCADVITTSDLLIVKN